MPYEDPIEMTPTTPHCVSTRTDVARTLETNPKTRHKSGSSQTTVRGVNQQDN